MRKATNEKVLAWIDGRGHTDAVIDWAAWAALRLAAPLEFLHVLERHPERADSHDYSGAIGPGAQDALLQSLSLQDELRSRSLREAGRELLAHARARAAAAGVGALDARLRHGEFVATAVELQADAALFVLGEHVPVASASRLGAEHHLEAVIRAVRPPVLVATADEFRPPRRIVIGFDGSAPASTALKAIARHALVKGLPVLVATVAPESDAVRRQLGAAQSLLAEAGVHAEIERADGDAREVLPALVRAQGDALLVMGAFGHARWRRWLPGASATTSTLLRTTAVPVLILR